MAKKIWFSKPLFYQWEAFNNQQKLCPYTADEYVAAMKMSIMNSQSKESIPFQFACWELLAADAKQELVHVFFEDESLKAFLENTKLADLEGIKKFLLENGNQKTIAYMDSGNQSNCVMYSFGLHIPYANEKNGYAFQLTVHKDTGVLDVMYTKGSTINGLSDVYYKKLLSDDSDIAQNIAKIYRLALNTIAYMHCYPECVKDGVPEIVVEYGEQSKKKKSITIKTSDKVLELSDGNMKSPHFRRGYMKYCGSDFYTECRGKFIFVSETMVKGNAKTVSKSTDLKSFEKRTIGAEENK